MKSRDAFIKNVLFNEALSGEFSPITDSQKRTHRLSRLTLAAAQKGHAFKDEFGYSHPDGRVYSPSWAPMSVAELWLPQNDSNNDPFWQQLIIREDCGRWPRQILFTHEPTRMLGCSAANFLVVRDTGTQEEISYHIAELGSNMDKARAEIAERAQDFYDTVNKV